MRLQGYFYDYWASYNDMLDDHVSWRMLKYLFDTDQEHEYPDWVRCRFNEASKVFDASWTENWPLT